jgi:hypothetical protein
MEYSKEDLMEAKTHNFGIMQWVTNLMNFTER